MKKTLAIIAMLSLFFVSDASAQSMLKKLGDAAKKAASGTVSNNGSNTNSGNSGSSALKLGSKGVKPGSGPTYYVSAETGSNRADGKSPASAMRDIQKVLDLISDNNQNGAVIRVAEGNYLGYLDAGYIEVRNFVTLEGGWKSDFSVRDPYTYITRIQPTSAQNGTNGSKALITLSKLDNTNYEIGGTLIIDGFMMDYGFQNNYYRYDPADEASASPEGVDTGRLLDNPSDQLSHQIIYSSSAIAGNMIVRNCLFLNAPYFGIQINSRCGEIDIYDNVFVSCRYSAVRIDGWDKEGYRSHVDFHHNTVAFSWCRDKIMEDMGYGYEYMSKVSSDVHHNVFLCNNYAAVARTHALSGPDVVIEAKRVTNLYDNCFFMNAADLQLPAAGGGKWTNVMVNRFDDVSEKTIPNIDGNRDLAKDDPVVLTIWEPYLNGFANLKVIASSSSFNPNSGANLYRSAHGMPMSATEIHRVSMYGNRYRFEEAMKFFGAKAGYGAQKSR